MNVFTKKAIGLFPLLYVGDNNINPKGQCHSGEVYVEVKRLRQVYGTRSGATREIKRTDESSRCHCTGPVLLAETYGMAYNYEYILEK